MTNESKSEEQQYIKTASVAYWYFRLNGFMTMDNFIIHPELREGSQKTDADLYGVRFPYRRELTMHDDDVFAECTTKPLFAIVEITQGRCKLNGPWKNRSARNIDYVLSAIGAFGRDQQLAAAEAFYEQGGFEDGQLAIRLFSVGRKIDDELRARYPRLAQITLAEMLVFIHGRFQSYRPS